MKSILNLFYVLFLAISLISITSCGDDEDPIVIDTGSDGINVADGLYLATSGNDPVSSALLSSEVVEAEGFATQERPGYVAGYMWLEAGSYNVVQIANKEATATIGGAAETITDEGSSCDFNSYSVVKTAVDGPAFTVGSTGLYLVAHDQTTSELVMYQIQSAGIIGNATEGGWGADTPLEGSLTSEGGSWTASDVTLRGGEFKMRFNCRWGINRRIDPNGSLDDAANGYQMFTNFGGTTMSLAAGGANFQQEEDGVYTVTIDWSPRNGWAIDTERTGDATEITFNPNDFNMGVIGSATAGSWDSDQDLFYKPGEGTHNWAGVVTLLGEGEMKFRANDDWDFNLGGDLGGLSNGGDNLATLGEGAYYIVLTTADDGETWSATASDFGWGVIGEGSPSGNWDMDTEMNADGFVDGITTYSVTGDFGTGGWKFRAGQDWFLNVGGDFSFLTLDGNNLELSTAGNYTVTLSFNGSEYSAEATAN